MALDDYWFDRRDVQKFIEALEKLGFSWEIVNLKDRPTMRIWKSTLDEESQKKNVIPQ